MTDESDKTFAFHDLRASEFPCLIECFAVATNQLVYKVLITGPGVVEVPNLVQEHGSIRVRTTTGEGGVAEVVAEVSSTSK